MSGSVGDLVPILGAEAADEASPETVEEEIPAAGDAPASFGGEVPLLPAEPAEATSWQQAPPVRRRPGEPAPAAPSPRPAPSRAEPAPPDRPSWEAAPPPVRQPRGAGVEAPAAPPAAAAPAADPPAPPTPDVPSAPAEYHPGAWEAPPIHPADQVGFAEPPAPPEAAAVEPAPAFPPPRRRRTLWKLTAGVVGAVALVIGGAFLYFRTIGITSLDQLLTDAQTAYENHQFTKAQKAFDEVANRSEDDPERAQDARFRARLSEARSWTTDPTKQLVERFGQFRDFITKYEDDPSFPKYRADVGEALLELSGQMLEDAKAALTRTDPLDVPRQILAVAREAHALARKYLPPDKPDAIGPQLAEVARAINREQDRRDLIEAIERLVPTPQDIRDAEQKIHDRGFQGDPDVGGALGRLRQGVLTRVRYVPADVAAGAGLPSPPSQRAPDHDPSLAVVPSDASRLPAPPGREGVVFGVNNGVLYALSRRDGRFLWADRVGMDQSKLPVRVPAGETSPEIVLVLSQDGNRLTARDVRTGHARWHHQLPAPCVGRPLLVGTHVYLPTYDAGRMGGNIYDVEILTGQLLGHFEVGMPFSVGGTHQPGTDLAYFPADSDVVYALNLRERRCVGVLWSNHPSGSLRSEPIVVSWDELGKLSAEAFAVRRSYLILTPADGLRLMQLRAFKLPVEGSVEGSAVEVLKPPESIRGWPPFSPAFDGVTLALATDDNLVRLYGVNQYRNNDPPLYALLPPEQLPGGAGGPAGRAQVVDLDGQDIWLLLEGKLLHSRLGMHREQGLRLVAVPHEAPLLGSPLHASQTDRDGRTIVTVTRSATRDTCLATAVDTASGRRRWQRQLGLLAQQDPLPLGSDVLVLDRGGGVFRFAPGDTPARGSAWIAAGQPLADPVDHLEGRPYLLLAPDGRAAVEVACRAAGGPAGKAYELVVRRFRPGGAPAEKPWVVPLGANHLAGTPAVGADAVWAPLDNGNTVRQLLREGARATQGAAWRPGRPDPAAVGHFAALGPDEFISTNDAGEVARWHWPAGEQPARKARGQLPNRVVSAPAVIPAAGGAGETRLCLADSQGIVWLLRADDLKQVRHWDLRDGSERAEITTGPFVRGGHVGCVVGQRRLVWLDPGRDGRAWAYRAAAGIVGQPALVGGRVLVADQSARFVALDAATGQPHGDGYTLAANVPPAAAPVPFGAGRAFVPLADGTVLLPALDRFGSGR